MTFELRKKHSPENFPLKVFSIIFCSGERSRLGQIDRRCQHGLRRRGQHKPIKVSGQANGKKVLDRVRISLSSPGGENIRQRRLGYHQAKVWQKASGSHRGPAQGSIQDFAELVQVRVHQVREDCRWPLPKLLLSSMPYILHICICIKNEWCQCSSQLYFCWIFFTNYLKFIIFIINTCMCLSFVFI